MTAIIILAVVGLLIYLGTKKKDKSVLADNKNSNTIYSARQNSNNQNFKSNLSSLPFPDRVEAIVWHINAIDKGLANGDLNLTNLSYAKLIESIRQQNVNENGNFEDHLQTIRKEYEEFRNTYGLEYPKQFLPPSQKQKVQPTTLKDW